MGFWDQEVFFSLYRAAQLKEGLGHDREEVIALYLRASDAAPSRAEALHGASRLCRNAGRHQEGYEICQARACADSTVRTACLSSRGSMTTACSTNSW